MCRSPTKRNCRILDVVKCLSKGFWPRSPDKVLRVCMQVRPDGKTITTSFSAKHKLLMLMLMLC